MFAEKEIEERIIDAISRLNIDGSQTFGSWNVSFNGDIKNLEDKSKPILISVGVGQRQYDTAQIPTANIACAIGVDVPFEVDPTGEKMNNAICRLIQILQDYQDDLCLACETFNTQHFEVAGFRLDGGSGLQRDLQRSMFSITFEFTLRGTIER